MIFEVGLWVQPEVVYCRSAKREYWIMVVGQYSSYCDVIVFTKENGIDTCASSGPYSLPIAVEAGHASILEPRDVLGLLHFRFNEPFGKILMGTTDDLTDIPDQEPKPRRTPRKGALS